MRGEEEDKMSGRDGKWEEEYNVCKVVEWCYILRIRRTLLHSLVCNIASYYMYMLTSIIKCLLSITTIAACLPSHKVPSNLVFERTGSN